MKALYFEAHGGLDRVQYGDFPDPVVQPGWVKVRVTAASLNWLDIETLRGMPNVPVPLPMVTGGDCVGEIAELGRGVTGWRKGERVLVDPYHVEPGVRKGDMLGETRPGALAEYVVVRSSQLIRLPDSISDGVGSCLPVAYGTAYRMITTRGQVRAGEKVLILGASGGVGTACVQLCRRLGAYVIAVASSAEKCEKLAGLGADETIDSSSLDFAEEVRRRHGTLMRGGGVSVIINYVGGDTWAKAFRCIAQHGRVLTCGAAAGAKPQTDLRYIFSAEMTIIGSDGWGPGDLQALIALVAEGTMYPPIAATLPLADGRKGLALLEQRAVFGKVVLVP